MFTRNKLAVLALVSLCAAWAQERPLDGRSSLKIGFPNDSPVTVVSADWGESRASARGSAMVLDLHTSLTLRNSSPRRIRGVTLLVQAQEVTPGGRASVSVPSLNVAPGETFPVRLELRLLRPLLVGVGPLVEVTLDGVLFEDLSFYGPNRLDSRRAMTAWEMEGRRDRRYFQAVLAERGEQGLREAVLQSLARQADLPRLDVQVARRGRATVMEAGRQLQFAFLNFPDSPVEPTGGMAWIAGNEARAPRLEVRNRSDRPVRSFEIGWIIRDRQGQEFLAGSVPGSDPELRLAPGETGLALEEVSLRFSSAPGRPVSIASMTGFVSQVEFADGSIWIPSRSHLQDPRLARVVAPSPEEQRLTELYRARGLAALVEELKKF